MQYNYSQVYLQFLRYCNKRFLCFYKCRILAYYIFVIMQINQSTIFLNVNNSFSNV